MGKVILDITMSLDGFIAGPDSDLEQLHAWLFHPDKPAVDQAILTDYLQSIGAVIMGNGTFQDGLHKQGWAGWVEPPPFTVPIFVLAHHVPEKLARGKTAFTFITDGIESALAEAQAVAGAKNVVVMGGAQTAQQFLQAGLLHEIHIHIAPLLLAQGKRLFEQIDSRELEPVRVVASPHVTHIQYHIHKEQPHA